MAENQTDDDDDEGFGDFKFVSPSFSQSMSVYQDNRVEDEWGDFMDNFSPKQDFFGNQPPLSITQTLNPANPSQTSRSFDLFGDFSDHSTKTTDSKLNHVESERNSASSDAKKGWEKPQGAIPLSIFGEEEEDPDSNNPSFNDTADPFPAKQLSSPVKNEVKFGQGLLLSDLIVNLYSQADQIKIENGSHSNLVDGDENFDDDGWQFKDAISQDKVGDRDSTVEVEVTSGLSGIPVETTAGTTDQQFQVNSKQSENFEGTLHKSGLSNGGLDSGDIFTTSDWLSHLSTGLDNDLGFVTGITTQNGSIFSQAKQNMTENGSNSKSGDANIGADDNFWDFKDGFSEVTSGLSGIPVETATGRTTDQQLQVGIVPFPYGPYQRDLSYVASRFRIISNLEIEDLYTVNGKQSENLVGTHKSSHSNGGLDSGDIFTTSDWFSHKSARLDNGHDFVTGMTTQNGSISVSFSQAKQNTTENGSNSKSGDGNIDADDNFWDFKDEFSEVTSGLSGIPGETATGRTTDQQLQVGIVPFLYGPYHRNLSYVVSRFRVTSNLEIEDLYTVNGKKSENLDGTLHKSSHSNDGLDSGDIFTTSDWLSHKSAGLDNGLGFVTSMATQNGSISVSFSQAKQNTTENGSNSKSGDGNIDADDNLWDFKDGFSDSEDVNCSSKNKGNAKGLGDHQESFSPSFFGNGKLNADDSLSGEDSG
ncbi:uncharacterized protein LOC122649068 [Telopea speciosissima]|uniref:uncharacterized protein LOC122649068 n=1 Tax=Telopea speciosissima TaxID=54955 RepID=UPI001CC7C359|nr:uncharacterized protein LOC122649068 [Telopea speciosissima]